MTQIQVISLETKYSALVDLRKQYRETLDEMNKAWEDSICWSADSEVIARHEARFNDTLAVMKEVEQELANIRSQVTPAVLRYWADRYYSRTPKTYECHVQFEHTVKMTGKKYKKWSFIGYSPIPEFDQIKEWEQKGDWVIVTLNTGKKERYNVGGTSI